MKARMSNARKLTGEFGVLIGVIVASIAFVMELTLIPLLLSAIQQDYGLSVGELSWVFNAYALAIAIAVLTGGAIGDMVNKQLLFIAGTLMFAVGSVMSAMSYDLLSLIVSRAVQGFGGGLFSPLVPVFLTASDTRRSGKILMIWGGFAGITATLLPLVGSALLTTFGWRAIFMLFAAVSLMALVLVTTGTPKEEARARRGIIKLHHLRALRSVWIVLLYIFLTYGCFTYFLFYFPISLNAVGFNTQSISILLTAVWLSFSVLSFLLRDKIDGDGLKRSLMLAPFFLALSFAISMAFPGLFPAQILSAVSAGAGLACSNNPSTHLLLRLSPPDLRVLSSSFDIIFARFGGAIMVALLPGITPLVASFVIVAVAALAIILSHRFTRLDGTQG